MLLSLFTRIYLTVLLTLVLTSVSVMLVLHQINQHRFADYTAERVHAFATLLEINSRAVPDERLTGWLAILSRLTGADWRMATSEQQPALDSQWWSQSARVVLATGRESAPLIEAQVTDWDELLVGTGLLMVNALSLVPTAERNPRLQALVTAAGLPASPVSVSRESLGFLQQRQLEQGQAVISSQNRPFTAPQHQIYIPMGQGNALKLGPVAPFIWLTPLGLLMLTGVVLPAVGVVIYGALVPLQRRMRRMIKAVDAIEHTPSSVAVPEHPADELGTMGQHVNRMAARLVRFAQRNREINQAVSHDLKTPLAQFKFALELLKPESRQAYAVGKMHQSVGEMESLIEELLLYHSLAEQPASDSSQVTDLASLVPAVLDSLPNPAGLACRLELARGPLRVAGEERLLRRLFGNLLANAFNYGHGQVTLSVRRGAQGRFDIAIEDDGPGIPAAERERVFEPFYRLDQTREAGHRGHGLGLAISRDIVTNLNGTLNIAASASGGCRVVLQLPQALQSQTNNEHHAAQDALK
ncbi:MAG: ATP-binding protein [Saccharospirillum sp.]|uniref:sensor histidine kinase n=1 Tax=Saccharospirillum sp. TaxID=2033801 RepID=UPI0034A0997D